MGGGHLVALRGLRQWSRGHSEAALHEEVRKDGVTVSALCPGPTATEFGDVAGWKPAGPSAKIFVDMAADSASVVRAGLAGLASGRAVTIPGSMNKATAQAHRFFPRS